MQVCDSAQYHDDHAFSSLSVLSKEPFLSLPPHGRALCLAVE